MSRTVRRADLDLDGTVIDVNRAPVEMCGFQRADVIGRPFWDAAGGTAPQRCKTGCGRQ